jgi:hypothetical protein
MSKLFPKKSGFISPEGEFLPCIDFGGNHYKEAEYLIHENGWEKEFEEACKNNIRTFDGPDFLLTKGYIRVSTGDLSLNNISFEISKNLPFLKEMLYKHYLGEYGEGWEGRIDIEFQNKFYSGTIKEFLSGAGRFASVRKYSHLQRCVK